MIIFIGLVREPYRFPLKFEGFPKLTEFLKKLI